MELCKYIWSSWNSWNSYWILESLGFVATTSSSQIYSADGINWVPIEPSETSLSNNKSYYSSVDGGVFQSTLTSECFRFTNDGKTSKFIPLFSSTTNVNYVALAYNSNNDTYMAAGVGSSIGSMATKMTRSYDKATQFALPILNDTFIKIL